MISGRNPLARVFAPVIIDNFLGDFRKDLFSFALTNRSGFKPAQTQKGLVPEFRIAGVLIDSVFSKLKNSLAVKFKDVILDVAKQLNCHDTAADNLEIELVYHGDGAFYRRHIDTATGHESKQLVRMLSLVYYFHAERKGFSGGDLRVFALSSPDTFIDIEPLQDRLVAFPSWIPHEVRPIFCPSGRFEDARFAVNCWVRRKA